MTPEIITMVLGGTAAGMFCTVMGRVWYFNMKSREMFERITSSSIDNWQGYTGIMTGVSEKINEIEEEALEDIREPIITKKFELQNALVKESMEARSLAADLKVAIAEVKPAIEGLSSAISSGGQSLKSCEKKMVSLHGPIEELSNVIDGIADFRDAFGQASEGLSEISEGTGEIHRGASKLRESLE
jgi:chromosome segregation ATPase